MGNGTSRIHDSLPQMLALSTASPILHEALFELLKMAPMGGGMDGDGMQRSLARKPEIPRNASILAGSLTVVPRMENGCGEETWLSQDKFPPRLTGP